jgi:hypothetical protein
VHPHGRKLFTEDGASVLVPGDGQALLAVGPLSRGGGPAGSARVHGVTEAVGGRKNICLGRSQREDE